MFLRRSSARKPTSELVYVRLGETGPLGEHQSRENLLERTPKSSRSSARSFGSALPSRLSEAVRSNLRGTVVNLGPADIDLRAPAFLSQLQAGCFNINHQGASSYHARRLYNQAPFPLS